MSGDDPVRSPVIAKWELFSVATMLIATHGDDAEQVVIERLTEALASEDEAMIIVWEGVLTQLEKLRSKDRRE